MRKIVLLFYILSFSVLSFSQENIFLAGIRIQKDHNFYFENGFNLEYTQQKYLSNKIYLGLSYATSRLGTAYNSYAIKQDNYLFHLAYYFRSDKIICPVVQLNTGYFYAYYGSPIFDMLPNTSMLLSLEPGIFLNFNFPVKAKISFGYNFITGNGLNGPGTLYPLFYQCSIYYQFKIKNKN